MSSIILSRSNVYHGVHTMMNRISWFGQIHALLYPPESRPGEPWPTSSIANISVLLRMFSDSFKSKFQFPLSIPRYVVCLNIM